MTLANAIAKDDAATAAYKAAEVGVRKGTHTYREMLDAKNAMLDAVRERMDAEADEKAYAHAAAKDVDFNTEED